MFLLSLLVGLFAGLFGTAFRWLLTQSLAVREFMFMHDEPWTFHLAVLVGMWLVAMGVWWLTQHVRLIGGSGIPQSHGVIFGRYRFGRPWLQFFGKFFGSLAAIGMGLSLGREGPSVQIGTLGATLVSKYFKSNKIERRYLLTAGAGAGLSAAFTAPIASIIFLIEDTLGWVSLRVGLPALLACVTAGYCAQALLPDNIYANVLTAFPDVRFFPLVLMLLGMAVIGALGGKLFNLTLFNVKSFYKKLRLPVWLKLLCVVGLTYIAGMFVLDLTSGGEEELIKQVLTHEGHIWWLLAMVLVKILFTAICYSTGLCGSLLLPLIVMGGLMGKAYSLLLIQLGLVSPETTGFFTIIGMAIFFVAVVRAPISGLMLILEMTAQYHVFFPMIVATTATFLLGLYLKTKPVYHELYSLMIDDEDWQGKRRRLARFLVSPGSVLIGHRGDSVSLPAGSRIIRIYDSVAEAERELNSSDIVDDAAAARIIRVGDVLEVDLPEEGYEGLFKIFRTLTNE
jgi:H+/Cl- antiporter ClcA